MNAELVGPSDPEDGARLLVHNHLTRDIKPEGVCPRCDFDRKPLYRSDEAGTPDDAASRAGDEAAE